MTVWIRQRRARSGAGIEVSGQLVGEAVGVLEKVLGCTTARRGLTLDLSGVTLLSPAAVELLRGLRRQGFRLVNCSAIVSEMLAEECACQARDSTESSAPT